MPSAGPRNLIIAPPRAPTTPAQCQHLCRGATPAPLNLTGTGKNRPLVRLLTRIGSTPDLHFVQYTQNGIEIVSFSEREREKEDWCISVRSPPCNAVMAGLGNTEIDRDKLIMRQHFPLPLVTSPAGKTGSSTRSDGWRGVAPCGQHWRAPG